MRLSLVFALCAAPVFADTREAVEGVIVPGYARFAASADALAQAAAQSCEPDALRPAFHNALDAWLAVSFLHFGPAEEEGRALAIWFWPDPKGLGAKAQRALLTGDPATLEPENFRDQSVAARGLSGLERLLWSPDLPADPCPLIRATAGDLTRLAHEIEAGWQGEAGFAATLLTAGEAGNTRYLSPAEARQAVFTQMMAGLEFVADQRLGRPLGDDRPRPERAEAKASERSQRNVAVNLQGLRRLAAALLPEAEATLAAFDRAIAHAGKLKDPVFAGVADPAKHEEIALLRQYVKAIRAAAMAEMAPALGVGLGFNSQDGD